ncbi:MAG: complex I NDUFA9 subunit family protein [Rhizobiales bacterium]|nr:complex I NDUFA9 subunit family protein [Hyphomicrobiales bacterium]
MLDASTIAANNTKLVTVFGGSGFVGRYVVKALAMRGYRIRVACRRPDLAGFLRPLGTVGQIQPVQANLRYPASVERALDGADAVINLVGILYASGRQTFDAVQAEGAATIAQAARKAGVSRLIQMSAIGADATSEVAYARSKAEGEAAVLKAVPSAVIIRPSIVFGPEDDFFNRFANMAAASPFLPLIGGGMTRFQPVYVGDVAEVVARGVDGVLQPGAVYELGGPRVASFRECLELMTAVIQRKPRLLNIPFALARVQAQILQLLPKPLLTVDQVRMLEKDNVVSDTASAEGRTLKGLHINPQSMEAILPTYLERYRPYGQFAPKSS